MGHFAKVLDGIVVQVIAAEPEFFTTFVDTSPGEWIQTSYNTREGIHYSDLTNSIPSNIPGKALRKNYAGIGFTYDRDKDAFIPPQIFPSWTLNETTCQWEPPYAPPIHSTNFGTKFYWDESSLCWKELK